MHFDLPDFENYLNNFLNFERLPDSRMLKLETMYLLCDYFGHPERTCPCFHVAGSKGKGTIANGIAAILRSEGYTTGVYSSPHAYHFTERVSTGETAFSKEIYDQAFCELRTGIDRLVSNHDIDARILTWFELVTLFSMLVFRLAKVDYAIYEVGMGGRLDATNVITPEAIAMGIIELEHTKYLGDTLAKIATEKSGVFKEKIPIISVPQPPEVQTVFQNQATKNHAKLHYITNISNYQELDAAVAAETVRQIIPTLDLTKARTIAKDIHLPGRYELIKNHQNIPYIILDGAHTVGSIRAILERMQRDGVHGSLIFACAADKNVEQIARDIISSQLFDHIYLTRPGDFKASDLPRAEAAFHTALLETKSASDIAFYASPDYKTTIATAVANSVVSSTPLIAFGSFYLLPEVKAML